MLRVRFKNNLKCNFWSYRPSFRSNHQRCSVKKVFSEISQTSQENACARVSAKARAKACNFIKKEALAQVFSCEFCEISKNTFSIEHLQTTTSVPSFPAIIT